MAAEATDGRAIRRARSRQRIVDAVVHLATEQGVEPTADKVAQLAGVTTRTVFRHFEDVESLRREIVADLRAQTDALRVPYDPGRDWREQLDELVLRRADIFERYTRHILWAQALRRHSLAVEADVQAYYQRLRKSIRVRLPAEVAARRTALAALEVVLSWEVWLRLRRDQKLSVKQSTAVVQNLVDAVLARQKPE
ncbi:MAG: TetR/AcrR family transcriptional regulator [Halioglobus sp.]|nr:TetR/AcrR family transcriptional regulator [Halioglobus sp.]